MATITAAARDWSSVAEAWGANVDEVDTHAADATAALLARVDIRPGHRVLELAAGPGSLGVTLSRLAGASGSVVLSDIAPGMVEVATRRNAELTNVTVEVLDASAIDRPDNSFDVVVSRMGLMFVPDPAVAFAEIHRVLAPGGRAGALTWAGIQHNPWMTCVGMAAMTNGLVAGAPPVGPGGIFSLGDADQLAALAENARFVDVTVEEFAITFSADTIDDHITRVSALAGPLAAAIQGASSEQFASFRQTAAKLAADYITAEGVEIPGRALLVSVRT